MVAAKNNTYSVTHGHASRGTKSRTYRSWVSMLSRCRNEKCKEFFRYGGRGILVCDRWKTFVNFLADMGIKPEGHSLDRINNNGNYEASNCRWATKTTQNRNTRVTMYLTIKGETKLVVEWAAIFSIDVRLIRSRIWNGFTPEECVFKGKLQRRSYNLGNRKIQGRFSAAEWTASVKEQ